MIDTQHKLKRAVSAGRWGNLPTMAELDQWHVETLVEEQADVARELGMYKQMLENAELRPDNRVLVKSLQVLDEQRYWLLDIEIERLSHDQRFERICGIG